MGACLGRSFSIEESLNWSSDRENRLLLHFLGMALTICARPAVFRTWNQGENNEREAGGLKTKADHFSGPTDPNHDGLPTWLMWAETHCAMR